MGTWLVTGGSGFLGRHLLSYLLGDESPAERVVGIGRRRPEGLPAASFVEVDLQDPAALAVAVEELAPDVVLHLAGRTPPAPPEEYERVNTRGTIHLLTALRRPRRPVRVVLAGSAAELGPVAAADLPVSEDHSCRPADAYARSKWYATSAGLLARAPLEVMVARVFNPIGPGMPESQAFGRFAARLAGPGPDPVRLVAGNLDARRDFVDARDVAHAFALLALWGRPGLVYNVGTGRSRSVREGLERLIALSGRRVELEPDPGLRPGPNDSRAAILRILDHTGWSPQIAWERSLADLWADMRDRFAGPGRGPSRHVA